MKRSLTWSMRFALAISAVFALAALAAGGIAYVLQYQEMAQRLAAEVISETNALALSARDGDLQDLTDQVAARASVSPDGSQIVAFVPVGDGAAQGNVRVYAPFEGLRHLQTGYDLTLIGANANPPEGFVAYGMSLPEGWIVTGRDDAWLSEQTEILTTSFGWGLGLAALFSTVFAVFIARRTEARIAQMEAVLEAVGAGEHGLRIRDEGRDDVARLAQSVDAALDQLEAGITAIRQVSTDVAHDLRAPLARLRLRLEPVAMDATQPKGTRQEIGKALEDLDQISGTFDAILRLARMQAGMVEIAHEPVDLAALCGDVFEMMAASAEDMGHDLRVEIVAPATVTGDRALLGQALVNLIDNALRHCPAPARITLMLQGGAETVLAVRDDGPGIPEADLARVRERFVRLEASRATPGSGLGLALVDTIARLHGAELHLANTSPGLSAALLFGAR
ncbi:signal transduction histidine kinase [Rhodobacter sp. JA431]|uniref:sensor histidine kinase n=1 Tax=Rhodobacter sp. JA431 TaxID=570013 RepID=UPI000BDA8314|nr:HAMP domain-containing sensor histidine kinase [Rhodobacter sp. JA431]SOC21437.1 signal transduction histidine kinase [Rhodobacter sp. JA431]